MFLTKYERRLVNIYYICAPNTKYMENNEYELIVHFDDDDNALANVRFSNKDLLRVRYKK